MGVGGRGGGGGGEEVKLSTPPVGMYVQVLMNFYCYP